MQHRGLDNLAQEADSLLRRVAVRTQGLLARVLVFDRYRKQAVDMLAAVAVARNLHSLRQVVQDSQQYLVFVHRELHWRRLQIRMPVQHIVFSFVLHSIIVEERLELAKCSLRTQVAEHRIDRIGVGQSAHVLDTDIPAGGWP